MQRDIASLQPRMKVMWHGERLLYIGHKRYCADVSDSESTLPSGSSALRIAYVVSACLSMSSIGRNSSLKLCHFGPNE